MTAKDLHQMLHGEGKASGVVVFVEPVRIADPATAWVLADHEADMALAAWFVDGGAEAYAVYRAAADRADAAHEELARNATRGRWTEPA